MRRVAVFARKFCAYSETFIHDELRHHTRYESEVLCVKRQNPERFPHPAVHIDGSRRFALTRRSRTFEGLCEARRYALIHAHFGTGGVWVAPLARRAGIPLVVTFHGYDVPMLTRAQRLFSRRWRYTRDAPSMLRQMALGLCTSTELREMLIEWGVPAETLAVHRLGIDLSRFRADQSARLRRQAVDPRAQIAMVGRLVPKKGFSYGLRAAAIAAEKFPIRVVVAGTGPLEAELRAESQALGIDHAVHFAGALPGEAIAALLAESELLLCPSVVASDGNRESGLLVAKEASACECVAIGTTHGGIPEIIDDGETGFLVPERNPALLAERLMQLLGDRARLARFGRSARRKMELEYDSRERGRALEDHYDAVVATSEAMA